MIVRLIKHLYMKQKKLFIEALETLMYSWGGDTPPEAFWGCNKLLDFYEKEYGIKFPERFDEDGSNAEAIIAAILK
jgi:hypothetical protein